MQTLDLRLCDHDPHCACPTASSAPFCWCMKKFRAKACRSVSTSHEHEKGHHTSLRGLQMAQLLQQYDLHLQSIRLSELLVSQVSVEISCGELGFGVEFWLSHGVICSRVFFWMVIVFVLHIRYCCTAVACSILLYSCPIDVQYGDGSQGQALNEAPSAFEASVAVCGSLPGLACTRIPYVVTGRHPVSPRYV